MWAVCTSDSVLAVGTVNLKVPLNRVELRGGPGDGLLIKTDSHGTIWYSAYAERPQFVHVYVLSIGGFYRHVNVFLAREVIQPMGTKWTTVSDSSNIFLGAYLRVDR